MSIPIPDRPTLRFPPIRRGSFLRRSATTLAMAAVGPTIVLRKNVAATAPVEVPAVVGRATQTVNFVHWGSLAKLTQLYGMLVRQFEAQHPTIKINMIPMAAQSWADFAAVMVTRMAGGDIPDIMRVDLEGLQLLARNNVLLPIDSLMHRDAAYVEAFRADSLPLFWHALSYQGQQLALPFTFATPNLLYSRRLMPAPGPNWTADDFLAMAARLKKKGLYGIGDVIYPGYALLSLEGWSAAAGASLLSADWSRSTATAAGNQVAWQFLYDLVHTHKVAPRPSPQFDDSSYFQAGRMGTLFDIDRSAAKSYALEGVCSARSCFADVLPLPMLGGGPRKALFSCNGFPIAHASKHPEAAWAWAMFLSSPQAMGPYTTQGAYLPCRSSLAGSSRIMNPPAHYHLYLDSLRAGAITLPAPPSFLELESAASRWFSKMMAQEVMPKAALAGLDADLTAILKRPV